MTRTVPNEWPRELPARIALVGEAPGDLEEVKGRPFVGPAGRLLNGILHAADVSRWDCFVGNVFSFKLPRNDVKRISKPRRVVQAELEECEGSTWHEWSRIAIDSGAYIPPELVEEVLPALAADLEKAAPRCVVALGATAIWALLRIAPSGKVAKIRGTVHDCVLVPGLKVIPTYHPASVLHGNPHHRTFIWADIARAASGELEAAPSPEITVAQSPEQVRQWLREHVQPGGLVAVDIETAKGEIDCIGFAPSAARALVVPFTILPRGTSYWRTAEEELEARLAIGEFLTNPAFHKVLQNGAYDVHWLWEHWRVQVRGWVDDTRLMHHALFPELKKDLATLGSLYTNFPSWKLMRGAGASTGKRDE